MEVYLSDRYREGPAQIVLDRREDDAEKWNKNRHWCYQDVYIGKTKVFLSPSETKTDGYSFTEEDLEELLAFLRKRKRQAS